ncbi:MAG: glycosyltransferase [Thermoplasmata archaeon]|nr:glycosyltransferase [Thermoplasmata archaeon]
MLSVLIPARNEIYLERTIRDVLDNAQGEVEVLVALDGYLPDPQIDLKDNRVIFYHYPESIGQRQCINALAKVAKGKYIMKLDAHCAVDKGFDVKMMADCKYDETHIARMYNLDVNTWKPKSFEDTIAAVRRGKLHDYMYIGWNEKNELRTLYYTGNLNKQIHTNAKLIDDTMSCMGPCFFMHKDRFWELGGCDESHGGWGQQGIEVACKAWLSGGSLKVNKKTWFAHWFRANDGGYPYPMSGNAVAKARDYSKDLWLNDKWPLATRKFQWLLDKFNPPTWPKKEDSMDVFAALFKQIINKKNIPKWRGVPCIKMPSDLLLYEQVLWDNRPDILIECGTSEGGSTLFYADIFNIIGKGHVISIDKAAKGQPKHDRITYIDGRMTACDTLAKVKELIKGKSVMVVLDGDHHRVQVKRELYHYAPMVTKGQFIVAEDIYQYSGLAPRAGQPGEAVDWFFRTKLSKGFKKEPIDEQFKWCVTKAGWIRRQA